MIDRQSENPFRFKLTHEDGTVEYVTLERADNPTVIGTPLNKNTLFNSKNSERYVADLPSEAFELLGKVWGTFTLNADGWSTEPDSEGYFTQEIIIDGMSEQFYPSTIPIYTTAEDKEYEKEMYSLIDFFITQENSITAFVTEIPDKNIIFILVGV